MGRLVGQDWDRGGLGGQSFPDFQPEPIEKLTEVDNKDELTGSIGVLYGCQQIWVKTWWHGD